jgi:hypothetical protein
MDLDAQLKSQASRIAVLEGQMALLLGVPGLLEEAERAAAERAAEEQGAAGKAAEEKAEAERLEAERLANEKAEAERLAAEEAQRNPAPEPIVEAADAVGQMADELNATVEETSADEAKPE